MLEIFFIWLWGALLLVPQMLIRVPFFGGELGCITLLVIYTGFTLSLGRGMVAVVGLSLMAETFSYVPPGFLVLTHLIIFSVLQLVVDQILTEAYLTKMIWVFLFYLGNQFLNLWLFGGFSVLDRAPSALGVMLSSSILTALASLPLFILLDVTVRPWLGLFSKQKAQITAADFYQVKSNQRKYLK